MEICVSASEIQFDNQKYLNGSYDFSVILIGQNVKEVQTIASINTPIDHFMIKAREDPLFSMKLNIETWKDTVLQKNVTGLFYLKFVKKKKY